MSTILMDFLHYMLRLLLRVCKCIRVEWDMFIIQQMDVAWSLMVLTIILETTKYLKTIQGYGLEIVSSF